MAAAKEIRGEQPQTDPAFSTDFNETARFTDLAIAVPRAKGDGLFFLPGGRGSAGVAPGGGVWYTDGKSTGSPPCRGGELLFCYGFATFIDTGGIYHGKGHENFEAQ